MKKLKLKGHIKVETNKIVSYMDEQPLIIKNTQYFPSFDGGATPAPVSKQALVLAHCFADETHWKHGIIATDQGPTAGAKEYYAVNDFMVDWDTIVYAANQGIMMDMHLYELLPPTRPVRPYFDVEYDAAAITDTTALLDTFCRVMGTCLEYAGFACIRSFSVYTASGPSTRYASGTKASFHLLCDTGDESFRSVADHCRFIQCVVMPFLHTHPAIRDQLMWGNGEYVLDGGVYKTHQTFRLPYQSKKGSDRPLNPMHRWVREGVADNSTWVYTCGRYEDPTTLSLHDLHETIRRPPTLLLALQDGTPHPEFDKAVALCSCLTPEFLQQYTETMSLVWLLWGMERTNRMRDHIHTVCQRGRNYDAGWVNRLLRDARSDRSFTIGSLVVWARACAGKERVNDILHGYDALSHCDELFTLRTDGIPCQETRHERYLGPLPLTEEKGTLLMKSALGTGKSVAIRRMIATHRCERILVLSPRKSYTHAQLHDLTSAELYPFHSYLDHVGPLSHLPYLIVQVESLWRIADDFEPYDLVIMDESESLLAQLHSLLTHGDHLIDNHTMMEMVVRTANRIVLTDAFLSDRSVQFARALRPVATLSYLENTFQPYHRTATRLVGASPSVEHAAFVGRILDALNAGQRIVVIWTSKAAGEAFEATHLRDGHFPYRFYHSDNDPATQEELRDVRDTWRNLSCLMMTTSITVGLSYDTTASVEMYDELFLYGSSFTALPRDVTQTLLRVRHLRADRLTYVIHATTTCDASAGLERVSTQLLTKEACILSDHPTAKWVTAPKWVKANHAWNENECVVSRAEYTAVLERYLEASGYRLETERLDAAAPLADPSMKEDAPVVRGWSEIPLLRDGDAERIRHAITTATDDEKQMYTKYQFRSQFTSTCPEEILAQAWERYHVAGRMNAFWNVVVERRWTLAYLARREAKQRYAIMSGDRIRKRATMEAILGCMGMKYSLQEARFPHNVLVELGPRLAAEETRWRRELGLPKSRRKVGDWKVEHTIQFIRTVMKAWGEVEVNVVRTRGRNDNTRTSEYLLVLNEHCTFWDYLKTHATFYDEILIII